MRQRERSRREQWTVEKGAGSGAHNDRPWSRSCVWGPNPRHETAEVVSWYLAKGALARAKRLAARQ